MYRVRFDDGNTSICSSNLELEQLISDQVYKKILPIEIAEVDKHGKHISSLGWNLQVRIESLGRK